MDMKLTSQATAADNLLAGQNQVTDMVTILSGEGALLRGQLLGRVSVAAAMPVAGAGNTGDGTIASVTLGGKARLGSYIAECVAAAVDGGIFKLIDPDGYALDAQATVGVAFVSDHLNFTINDGATDFVVGDTFTLAVGAGSGKYRVYSPANTDGSQRPAAILAQDADATTADAPAEVYFAGQFSAGSVAGYSASLKDTLRTSGIFIKTNG
ncbi:MAG: head decoration protein [Nitrospinota bacterium]|nr:head decoration protein [Nitrospinota bacterium]